MVPPPRPSRRSPPREEWFALDRDVPSVSLPLEIKKSGAWRHIAHDKLKLRYEDLEVMPDDTIRLGHWCLKALERLNRA